MTIPVGTILKVVASLLYPADAGINQNVFNALIDGAGGPFADSDIVDDAVAWGQNMYLNLDGLASELIQGSQVQVYKWDTVGLDWDEVGAAVMGWTPTNTSDYLPRGVAALVMARTTNPDVLGKKYIPGLCETGSANGLWNSPVVTALLALAADWVTGFTGGTSGASWNPGVWSPTHETLYDMSEVIIANVIPAYQRRRKRGVGI
ncbi:MAG: hypothetical protein KAJ55_17710 [Anaerolineales bacterium]|nr:hypothetical protein [Anaerolineales bacterium]